MGARLRSAMRSIWKNLDEGLMWMGLAWSGTYPPFEWEESSNPPADQPCLPPLSEEENAAWAALVKHLR